MSDDTDTSREDEEEDDENTCPDCGAFKRKQDNFCPRCAGDERELERCRRNRTEYR
jgi:hypothetical protein